MPETLVARVDPGRLRGLRSWFWLVFVWFCWSFTAFNCPSSAAICFLALIVSVYFRLFPSTRCFPFKGIMEISNISYNAKDIHPSTKAKSPVWPPDTENRTIGAADPGHIVLIVQLFLSWISWFITTSRSQRSWGCEYVVTLWLSGYVVANAYKCFNDWRLGAIESKTSWVSITSWGHPLVDSEWLQNDLELAHWPPWAWCIRIIHGRSMSKSP